MSRTQGPWTWREALHEAGYWIDGPCDHSVAETRSLDNARSIAGLPELIEAARALLRRIDNLTSEEFSKGGEREEREALETAAEAVRETLREMGEEV